MSRVKLELPKSFSFSTGLDVRITDVNYGGHLGNDALLSLLHTARVRFFKSLGYTELDIAGVGIMMVDAELIFAGEAFEGDPLTIYITPQSPTKIGCELFYRVVRDTDEKEIARAKTGFVFFDYGNRKIARMPEEFGTIF